MADTGNTIWEFRGPYWFLSNFYPCRILYYQKYWRTAEHLYQALKTNDPEERERIRLLPRAADAKRAGRLVTLRPGWDDSKVGIMSIVVLEKFSQDDSLARHLVATGDKRLVEGNRWGDTFWGVDLTTQRGDNNMGIILMDVRELLLEQGAA